MTTPSAVLTLMHSLADATHAVPLGIDVRSGSRAFMPAVAVRFSRMVWNRWRYAIAGASIVVLPASAVSTFVAVATATPINPKVIAAERVSVDAVRLTGLMGGWRSAAPDVDSFRYRLQMRRITARSIPAQVVQYAAIRNLADKHLIDCSVRCDALALPIAITVTRSGIAVARIRPAFTGPILHGSDEAFNQSRFVRCAHSAIYNRRAHNATHA